MEFLPDRGRWCLRIRSDHEGTTAPEPDTGFMTLAGYAMDHFRGQFTFVLLASVAACGLGSVWLMLPETCPEPIGSRMTLALRHTHFGRLRRRTVDRINRLGSSGRQVCQWIQIGLGRRRCREVIGRLPGQGK